MKVGKQGRIVIPAEIRKELDIEPGDELVPRIEDGRLVLGRQKDALKRIQELFADLPRPASGRLASEELIAERREEARLEEEKWKRLGLD